jgi:hypothetical protein
MVVLRCTQKRLARLKTDRHAARRRVHDAARRLVWRVEVLDGDQDSFGGVVLGDHDGAALNGHLQNAPELAFRFAREN